MKSVSVQLKSYLKEPYPYYYSNQKRLLFYLILISILSFCFSYVFEPFEVNTAEHKIDTIFILIIHAFIPLPISYIFFSIINKSQKHDTNWTLGKEIFHLSMLLLIIGLVGFLCRDVIYKNPDNWSLRYFWEEIRNTFLVGFLILIIVLPLNLERLINKHTSLLKQFSKNTVQAHYTNSEVLNIISPNENFEFNRNEFLYAKVEGNYTDVYIFSKNNIHKRLLRITLKELEDQLQQCPFFFKTHRSYLVNLEAITSISGNAQGYLLTLKNDSVKVPVSRSNIKAFNSLYAKCS